MNISVSSRDKPPRSNMLSITRAIYAFKEKIPKLSGPFLPCINAYNFCFQSFISSPFSSRTGSAYT